MNYEESLTILAEVKKAKKVLLNCHVNPDPDGVGGAVALAKVIADMGKEVTIISSFPIDENLNFLAGVSLIKVVDYSTFDFSKHDLFISVDSSSFDRAIGKQKNRPTSLKVINIDHHQANEMFGAINLVDEKVVAVCEILFRVFEDWGVKIDTPIASALLTGIIGDSGVFRYPTTTTDTLKIACQLMELGADKNKIIFNLYYSYGLEYFKFWSKVLGELNFDQEHHFIWSAVPYDIFIKCGGKRDFKETTASLFFELVKGTDFGILAVEQEKGKLSASLRSRTGLDTSQIARELGGGGHIYASGAKVELPFDRAVKKVLEVARKYAKKTS